MKKNSAQPWFRLRAESGTSRSKVSKSISARQGSRLRRVRPAHLRTSPSAFPPLVRPDSADGERCVPGMAETSPTRRHLRMVSLSPGAACPAVSDDQCHATYLGHGGRLGGRIFPLRHITPRLLPYASCKSSPKRFMLIVTPHLATQCAGHLPSTVWKQFVLIVTPHLASKPHQEQSLRRH
jgi:hypothetical protein